MDERRIRLTQGHRVRGLVREADDRAFRTDLHILEVADDARAMRRAVEQVRSIVMDPSVRWHPLAVDVLSQLLDLDRMIRDDPDLTDPHWRIRRAAADVTDVLNRLLDEANKAEREIPTRAAHFVATRLAGADQTAVAEILGVDPRTVRLWRKAEPRRLRKDPDRVRLVAEVVHLLGSLPATTVVTWFRRPRSELGRVSPLGLIERSVDAAAGPVTNAARGMIGQLAT